MRCVTWSFLLALLAGLAAPPVHAESVEERAKVSSSTIRLRGASGIGAIPGGYISSGGSRLQILEGNSKQWRTLHRVPGDNLYRVKAAADGRLMAAWENERVFHLFDRARGTHLTIPKPPDPPGYPPDTFHVEGLYFDDNGRDALVFIDGHPYLGPSIGQRGVVAAYRVPLDGKTAPRLLFVEEGVELHKSPRGAIMIKARNWQLGCFEGGCNIESIIALELDGDRVTRRTLLEAGDRHIGAALPVKGCDEVRFAAQLSIHTGNKHSRGLLRFHFGGRPEFLQLPESTSSHPHHSLLTRSDEFVEVRQGDDRSLTMTRTTVAGEQTQTVIPPWTNARGRREKGWFQSVGERADGSLWMHWADHLVFVRGDAPPRKVDISAILGRGTEWAGAYVYVTRPEGIWFGIEMGGGRDYRFLDMAELERRSVSWTPPAPGSDAPAPLPLVAEKLRGQRRTLVLGGVTVSVGDNDIYARGSNKESWRLLYGLPGRSIYRMATDEAAGRIVASWSAERELHLFQPGTGTHERFPWPVSDIQGLNSSLQGLFFSDDGRYALVYMNGRIMGRPPDINELYLVPLDRSGPPYLMARVEGQRWHISQRGATFVKANPNHGCSVAQCVIDAIVAVDIAGGRATERVIHQPQLHTDYVGLVRGSSADGVALLTRHWPPKGVNTSLGLLRFRYGYPGVDYRLLPPGSERDAGRTFVTSTGEYMEMVAQPEGGLSVRLHGWNGELSGWDVPAFPHTDIDSAIDRAVYGIGQRQGGGFWLHWGDHLVLLGDGRPRAYSLVPLLPRGSEWAGADRYEAAPEKLVIGADRTAGRDFVSVDFATVEKRARVWGTRHGAR
ncbi:hypothetical protein [Archangium sp.]|uniref:hypothetical protein n=1 Tax=Archangium sp. TaxID=1872627 RepID=UPI002D34B8B2|nr:hypothetical protein [Archangium sp.]HYO52809.1 hypothetical protein [Archangium sp.]